MGTQYTASGRSFADGIGLFPPAQKDTQEKAYKVDSTVRTVGLTIHPSKTKLMKLNPLTQCGYHCKRESNGNERLGSFTTT